MKIEKIELNKAGIGALLKSDDVMSMIQDQTAKIHDRCGDDYQSRTYVAGTRCVGIVATNGRKSRKDNFNNNTLLKALH